MESGQGWETGWDQGNPIAVTIRVQKSLHTPLLLCAPECLVIGAPPLYACQGGTSRAVLGSVLEQAREVFGILLWGGQARDFCYCSDPWIPVPYILGSHVLSPNFAPSTI